MCFRCMWGWAQQSWIELEGWGLLHILRRRYFIQRSCDFVTKNYLHMVVIFFYHRILYFEVISFRFYHKYKSHCVDRKESIYDHPNHIEWPEFGNTCSSSSIFVNIMFSNMKTSRGIEDNRRCFLVINFYSHRRVQELIQ